MRIHYINMYKKEGVIKSTDIKKPKISKGSFSFPSSSALHYLGYSDVAYGPVPTEPIIKDNIKDGIYLHNVTTLLSTLSSPKVNLGTLKSKLNKYTKSVDGAIIPSGTIDTLNKNKLAVYNYLPLSHSYKYKGGTIPQLDSYRNILSTVLITIADINEISPDTNNFIYSELPDVIYEPFEYDMMSKLSGLKLFKYMDDPNQLLVLELHKYATGASSLFDVIPIDNISKVTLVITNKGGSKRSYINLGMIKALQTGDDEVANGEGASLLKVSKMNRASLGLVIPNMYSYFNRSTRVTAGLVESEDSNALEIADPYKDVMAVDDIIDDIKNHVETDALNENPKTSKEKLLSKLEDYADRGGITNAQKKAFQKKIAKAEEEPSALIKGSKLHDHHVLTKDETALDLNKTIVPDNDTIFDKSIRSSVLGDYDKKYINEVMPKHYANVISSFNKGGILVTGHTVETHENVLGKFEAHTIKFNPIDGKPSTISFKMPKLNDDGTYENNGNTYRLRKQKIEIPIRKIDSGRVMLTSYYGKLNILRSSLSVDDETRWIDRQLSAISNDPANNLRLTKGDVHLSDNKLPTMYARLSRYYIKVERNDLKLVFSYKDRSSLLKKGDTLKSLESKGDVLIGVYSRSGYLVMDKKSKVHRVKGDDRIAMGTMFDIFGLDKNKAPKDLAIMNIMGKSLPVSLFFGYHVGLYGMMKMLKVKWDVLKPSKRVAVGDYKLVFKFNDVTLGIKKASKVARLILQGVVKFHKLNKMFSIKDFNNKDVYLTLLESLGLGIRHLNEFETMDDYFVDPITGDYLVKINEPDEFRQLLIKSVEYLTNEDYPDITDGKYMRIRGYERFPGAVYSEIIKSIRAYKGQINKRRKVIEMSPYAPWQLITEDPANKLVEQTNPITMLKEAEVVTFTGVGGRSRETMSIPARKFHHTSVGVMSEANVDSTDVGITAYLSANPQLGDIYGTNASEVKKGEDNWASTFSTTYQLSVRIDGDDPKRKNFAQIMSSHKLAVDGAKPGIIRTGAEPSIAYRMGPMFAVMASDKGKVIKVSKKSIKVKFSDGTEKGYHLGTMIGKAEGSAYPHKIVTDLEKGDTFKKDETITYNTGFFEPDPGYSGMLVYKSAALANVSLYEGIETNEDSAALGPGFAASLGVSTVKQLRISLSFDQHIHNLVKVGDKLMPDSTLVTIEDDITYKAGSFGSDGLEALNDLMSNTPLAKYEGIVDSIEVKYHGESTDMSPSLQKLVKKTDAVLAKARKVIGKKPVTGKVTGEYRVKGNPLLEGNLEIMINLIVGDKPGVGDKIIVANQLKAVIGVVYPKPITTEHGDVVDIGFGYRSAAARIVNSFIEMGAGTTILHAMPKHIDKLYNS